jgi:hypothetical protein
MPDGDDVSVIFEGFDKGSTVIKAIMKLTREDFLNQILHKFAAEGDMSVLEFVPKEQHAELLASGLLAGLDAQIPPTQPPGAPEPELPSLPGATLGLPEETISWPQS